MEICAKAEDRPVAERLNLIRQRLEQLHVSREYALNYFKTLAGKCVETLHGTCVEHTYRPPPLPEGIMCEGDFKACMGGIRGRMAMVDQHIQTLHARYERLKAEETGMGFINHSNNNNSSSDSKGGASSCLGGATCARKVGVFCFSE